jgi:hypothetical protein
MDRRAPLAMTAAKASCDIRKVAGLIDSSRPLDTQDGFSPASANPAAIRVCTFWLCKHYASVKKTGKSDASFRS